MAVKLIAQILLLLKLTFWKIKTCKFLLTQSFTVIRRLITSFDLWRELLALHVLLFVLLCIKKIYIPLKQEVRSDTSPLNLSSADPGYNENS